MYCLTHQTMTSDLQSLTSRLGVLLLSGYVAPITLADDVTPDEIDTSVKAAFENHPNVTKKLAWNGLENWRLLYKLDKGQGTKSLLVSYRVGGSASTATMFDVTNIVI
jgi:hypothetical protein